MNLVNGLDSTRRGGGPDTTRVIQSSSSDQHTGSQWLPTTALARRPFKRTGRNPEWTREPPLDSHHQCFSWCQGARLKEAGAIQLRTPAVVGMPEDMQVLTAKCSRAQQKESTKEWVVVLGLRPSSQTSMCETSCFITPRMACLGLWPF